MSVINIEPATMNEVDAVVELESRLFTEDSGTHEPYADITWPAREGHEDCRKLISDDHGIVLLAHDGSDAVGLLMGYSVVAGSTRQPIRYGVLRSMYVASEHRRSGVARQLTERFIEWARVQGCAEVQVNHYVANTGAGSLYESCGFRPHSLNRVLLLE